MNLAPPAVSAVSGPFWSTPLLAGEEYKAVLQRLHQFLEPRTYLEVGVHSGDTLALAQCPSIGIDPAFILDQPVLGSKQSCCLYQMTSDRFFARHDPSAIFGHPIDLAFLDGLHYFEFLLRDFINTEKYSRHNSIICLHDCIPCDSHVGRRDFDDHRFSESSPHQNWWAGDVWKVVAILMEYRPELHLHAFDALPTGLIGITGLNPGSSILAEAYFDIVAKYRDLTLAEAGDDYLARLPILNTRSVMTYSDFSKLFWL